MIGKVKIRHVPNSHIFWAGGYPCGVADTGTVHAVWDAQMNGGFVCGTPMGGYKWTKKPLNCKRCKATIRKERKKR